MDNRAPLTPSPSRQTTLDVGKDITNTFHSGGQKLPETPGPSRQTTLDVGRETADTFHSDGKKILDLLRGSQKRDAKIPDTPSDSLRDTKGKQIQEAIISSGPPKPSPFSSPSVLLQKIDTYRLPNNIPGPSARDQLQDTRTFDRDLENDLKSRIIRTTGNPDFLKTYPKHSEITKMRYALARKMRAYQSNSMRDYYSAHKELVASETILAQEAKMMRSLESSLRGLEYMESRLGMDTRGLHDEPVIESIRTLNADLTKIQEKQSKTIDQWEKIKVDIEQCVYKLRQHTPDLPLPEMDKALTFPKGKAEKNEQSDKKEKDDKKPEENKSTSEALKGADQQSALASSSSIQLENTDRTIVPKPQETNAEAKELLGNLESLIYRAQSLHMELTSLNNQWDNFIDKRTAQMDQLKSSQELQSKRFSEALNTLTAGADKGKSDIATAMKYANRLVALAAVTVGGGGLRLRM